MATVTRLPDPPAAYSQEYMQKLLSQLNIQMRALAATSAVLGTTLNLATLPTAAAGLRSGEVWRDASAGNVLKIVP